MKKHKIMIACSIFAKELQAALSHKIEPEIIWIDAGLHADLHRLEKELIKAFQKGKTIGADMRVFFVNRCYPDIARLAKQSG